MNAVLAVNSRFRSHRVTGVERYSAELVAELAVLNRYVREVRPRLQLSGIAGHLWEQMVLPHRLVHGARLWSPANTGPLAVPDQILTVHDASPLDHPEWFRPLFGWWYRLLWPRLLPRVAAIHTPSQFSRQRLLASLPLDPSKIHVVPGGVSAQFRPLAADCAAAVRKKYRLPEQFILFVGTLEPRKNLPALIVAWRRLRARYPQLGLVLAGRAGQVFKHLELPSDGAGLHFPGYVPEADLPGLYNAARVFVLPSLYEGYGLTLLEAMACGTPVIFARCSALPEVAGPGGLGFDPQEECALVDALERVIDDQDLRWELSAAGLERAGGTTWQHAARVFLEAAGN